MLRRIFLQGSASLCSSSLHYHRLEEFFDDLRRLVVHREIKAFILEIISFIGQVDKGVTIVSAVS